MLEAVALTDIGMKRKLNQDYVHAEKEKVGNLPNLFIVADGMGGHSGGELASRWTVEIIIEEITSSPATDAAQIFEQALRAANRAIRGKAREDNALYGMGTTVVAATIDGSFLRAVNVGDSRLYLADPKQKSIRQVTTDHSLVEEMVEHGEIAREEARVHPDKHIITRAIGARERVQADFFQVEILPHELILLCSDGLSNMLGDEEIGKILYGRKSIGQKADELVKAANDKGGHDNISVVLARTKPD